MTVVELSPPGFANSVTVGSGRIREITIPTDDGRLAYYKLRLTPAKEALFNRACKEGVTVDLRQYGTILESYYMPGMVIAPLKVETVG